MSDECCREFTGWFKSFTRVERALAALEAALLVALLALLVLLILHLVACSGPDYRADVVKNGTTPIDARLPTEPKTSSVVDIKGIKRPMDSSAKAGSADDGGAKCSWTPSAKTTAAARYYEDGAVDTKSPRTDGSSPGRTSTASEAALAAGAATVRPADDRLDLSDGEEAEDEYRRSVVALVKLKPPKDIIFGCILTVVSERWTLTAASCVEAIEETDSLDSFVIMERYGAAGRGALQAVDDVRVHPRYEAGNESHDLAALRSAGALAAAPLARASALDLALLTLAERLTLLGFGAFRSIDGGAAGRALRRARVLVLGGRACAAQGGGAVLRHLWAGRAAAPGGCGRRALCAGVAAARGLPCNYCAGAPLLRGRRLLALMADNRQCGVACEPQLYVSLPDKAAWIDATLADRSDE